MSAVPREATNALPTVPLTEVAYLVRGVSYPKTDAREEPTPGYVPVLRATNIQDAHLILDANLVFIAERNVSQEQRLRPGDIVIATSSGSKHLVGKSARFHGNWDGSFGAFCAAIRPKSNIDPRFLALFLQSPYYWKQVTKKAVGVNINNLRRGDLETLTLPLPTFSEQRRIVAEVDKQFSRLDEAVTALKRTRTQLDRYRASVRTAACTGLLVESHARSWPQLALDKLVTIVQYGSSSKTSASEIGVPVLRMGNIVDGTLILDELKYLPEDHDEFPALFLEPGDLLFNRTNSPELVGKSAVYQGQPVPCSFASYLIRLRFKPEVLPEFVACYLNSSLGRSWIKRVVSQQVGQANVNGSKLKALVIALPPLETQRRIVAEVERSLSVARETERQINANLVRAVRMRNAVLAEAFSMKADRETIRVRRGIDYA